MKRDKLDFNTTIQLIYESDDGTSDELGNGQSSWMSRGSSQRAERVIVRGAIQDIAAREQATTYSRFTIRASDEMRAISTSDRLSDLYGTTQYINGNATTTTRTYEVTNVVESEDRRTIMIEAKSLETQGAYNQ